MSDINPTSRAVDLSAYKALEQMQLKPSPEDGQRAEIKDTFQRSTGQEPPPNLLPVPDTRQSVDYSCGAASLQAVLMYYGDEYMESSLMEMLGTTTNGTNPKDIVRVAEDLGYTAELKENLTIEDLENSVKKGIPVIVDGQAWRDGDDLNLPWSNVWESGHYMVVIGTDKKNVYLEDPSMLGSRGIIPREEFLERWHDYDDKKYYNMGIFIAGKEPNPPKPLMHVD